MIGIDTNVLVRFLVQDDAAQGAQASAFIASLSETAPGFIAREVMVETVWVLERAYNLPRAQIAAALEGLLEARELVVEASDRVAVALDRYAKGGAGFSDQMIALAGVGAGCSVTLTFDRKAALGPGMQLMDVPPDH
jgi:predicted nucleic-acid-binding protein